MIEITVLLALIYGAYLSSKERKSPYYKPFKDEL